MPCTFADLAHQYDPSDDRLSEASEASEEVLRDQAGRSCSASAIFLTAAERNEELNGQLKCRQVDVEFVDGKVVKPGATDAVQSSVIATALVVTTGTRFGSPSRSACQ